VDRSFTQQEPKGSWRIGSVVERDAKKNRLLLAVGQLLPSGLNSSYEACGHVAEWPSPALSSSAHRISDSANRRLRWS